jgi:sterol 3beta-glucosyltransferase
MKIAITTLGTRGDLQPFIPLALGLQQAGYEVVVISSKNEQAFTEGFGLPYRALNVDIQQIMEDQEVQKMTKGDNPIAFFRSHLNGSKKLKQSMIAVQHEIWEACADADALVYHPGLPNGYYIAQQMGIPCIMASPFPVTKTNQYPAILFYKGPRFGKWYNLLTHTIFEKIFWLISKSAVKIFWKSKGLSRLVKSTPPSQLQYTSGMPIVYGYSEHLFTRDPHWNANVTVTGYWTSADEHNWIPPTELVDFIQAASPPIYIGFGSIKDTATYNETIQLVLHALELTQQRAVIALGWNTLMSNIKLPKSVFLLQNAPHTWLFPQMAVVVHHGGAGITAVGLIAGKPTIIIPHSADQPAWGKRVMELGVGPNPIPRKKLTAAKLASAIQATLAPQMITKATELGNKLRLEKGVENAVSVIQAYLNSDHFNPKK